MATPQTELEDSQHQRSRWGVPIPLHGEVAPEPIDWRPSPKFRTRVLRAVATPALLGGIVFVIAVVVAIAIVAFRSHEPSALTPDGAVNSAAQPHADGAGTNELAPRLPGSKDGAGALSAGAAAGSVVYVHVVGEVNQPGVVELDAGDRIEAAIEAAGGATEAAELSSVNLAREVVDGEQIVVPDAAAAAAVTTPSQAGAGDVAADALINLNSADAALLETLPRVGPALAQRIIDWREVNGPFVSVEQLREISGIGAKTLEGFRDRIGV